MTYRKDLTVEEYINGVITGDRVTLARAITLVESNSKNQLSVARKLLSCLLPRTGQSIRIGITGMPGVGKSTFIESFGNFLCESGYHVAILAIDPSSTCTQGSVLGDKARMERLSQRANCFIRPSPSRGILGGVNDKTRESVLVCEAAGFNVILVETVGVGQNESAVRAMVDLSILLIPPVMGDGLQSIKRGVIEQADAILVNKADGENRILANQMKEELNQVLSCLTPATKGWKTRVSSCSSKTGEGVAEMCGVMKEFQKNTRDSGVFHERRSRQLLDWLREIVLGRINLYFFENPSIISMWPEIEKKVTNGTLPVQSAADTLLQAFMDYKADLKLGGKSCDNKN